MNLRELQTEAHAIAVVKGWYDRDDEVSFGDRIASIHSELSEALEAYRAQGLETWHTTTTEDGWTYRLQCTVTSHVENNFSLPANWTIKPEGVASELADVVIRVAEMAEHYGVWVDAAFQRASVGGCAIPQSETFGEWVTYVHYWASKAASEYWQARAEDEEDIPYWADAIGQVIRGVVYMAAHYGLDLDAAIEAKMEYNRTRPYRHGGKA